MLEKEITFDRFIRGLIVLAGVVAAILMVRYLSGVLLPFVVAWAFSYMLYPLVRFLQYKCHLRYRVLCIVIALLAVLVALTGVMMLVVPQTIQQASELIGRAQKYVDTNLANTTLAQSLMTWLRQNFTENEVAQLFRQHEVQTAVETLLAQAWGLITRTYGILVGVLGMLIVLLYTFFLLMDYEKIVNGWSRMVPRQQRPFLQQLVSDVEQGMNSYFRGQSLIAFLVGILFAIGFSIIRLPMAIGLGLFIGVLNLVPYLQILGFLPAFLCVTMSWLNGDGSFGIILIKMLAVFAVVQGIQDMVLTPRIMGHQMGLSPAVILLSLSVWGALLGFIGLIIALPLTTLCISYYKRYVLKEEKE